MRRGCPQMAAHAFFAYFVHTTVGLQLLGNIDLPSSYCSTYHTCCVSQLARTYGFKIVEIQKDH